MSYQEERLQEIADAIREVKGTTEKIPATNFASEIVGLSVVKPSGIKTITENGDYDVSNYAWASVKVEADLNERVIIGKWFFEPENLILDFKTGGIVDIGGNSYLYTIDGNQVSITGGSVFYYNAQTDELMFEAEGMSFAIQRVPTTLIPKEVTENGTYKASDDGADGYSEVVVNVAGSGGGGDYDLVITTQEEFDNWVTTLNNGTCTAASVLIVGDGGTTIFNTSQALNLPDTLYRINGINDAKLKVSGSGFKYTTKKDSPEYSISNLTIYSVSSGFVITNCCNLNNLNVSASPGIIPTNKKGRNPQCLSNCTNIYDCTITGYAENEYASATTGMTMYNNCSNFFNVKSVATFASTYGTFGTVYIFSSCSNIYNCTTTMSYRQPVQTTMVYYNCNVVVGNSNTGTCGGTFTREQNCTNVFDIEIV